MEEQNQTPVPEKKSNLKKIMILGGAVVLIIAISAGGFFLYSRVSDNNSGPTQDVEEQEASELTGEPTRSPSSEVTYSCAENKTIQASFYNEGDFPSVSLVLSDGTSISLYRVESGSGARYANNDESMVFWNSGNETYIEESGEQTYIDCVENS